MISEKPKITVVSSYYEPDVTASTYLYVDLAEDFEKYGADVTAVCGIPTRLVDPTLTRYYAKHPIETRSNTFKIIRSGPQKAEGNNLIGRSIYHLIRSYAVYRAAKKVDTDVYVICSAPPFMGIAGAILSKKALTVYGLQDIFPDSIIHAKGMRENHFLVKLFRSAEQFIYKRNTHIITISDDMKETILSRGVPEQKVSVIYDWIDEQRCVPVPREDNVLFERFGLPRDRFYVSYAGNIGLLQNVGTILGAAEILEKTHPEINFVIIGDGAWKARMEEMITEKELSNVRTFPMQPVGDISYIYSLGDVELVSLKPDVTKMALPSKTWSILSAGRPVVCEIDLYSKLCDIIRDNGCGLCVAPGDFQALADAILTLYRKPAEELGQMGQNGRAYIENNLTRAHATKKHYEQIVSLLEREGTADVQG